MALAFPTTSLKKPSGVTAIPSGFKRPGFGTLYGFDAQGGAAPAFPNSYSLSLDGSNDYLSVDTSVLNFYRGGGAISAWIKPSSVTGTSSLPHKYRSIISKADVYINFAITNTGYPTLHFYDGAVKNLVASTQVSTSAWTHVLATWTTSGSKLFVNGTEEVSSSETPANVSAGQASNPAHIGKTPAAGADFYGGLIDELALFTTDQESNAGAIYNSGNAVDFGTGGLNLGPENWWRMGDNDSGTGTTVTDQGSGSNDGTLTNGATFSTDVPS